MPIALGCLIGLFSAVELNAQCDNTPSLSFHSPQLISGTNHQPGAVYRFPNVLSGVDCQVTITALVGGATLSNIDDSTTGYYEAFQPKVNAAANDTSYIDWLFTFKKTGTSIDTSIACMSVTGIDVDGDNSKLREFIEAETPGSISVDPNTNLQVSFDGVRSRAVSTTANVANIDTNQRKAMFQMNFANLSSLVYRNGSITTGAAQTRQTSIYFKKFFQTFTLLPIRLLNFTAIPIDNFIQLKWSVTGEGDVKEYTLQRSTDGKTWNEVGKVPASEIIRIYTLNDFGKGSGLTYYRLKQHHVSGFESYSKVIRISADVSQNKDISHNSFFDNSIRLQITLTENDEYTTYVYTAGGIKVKQQSFRVTPGSNTSEINLSSALPRGIYLLVISNNKGRQIYHGKLIRI